MATQITNYQCPACTGPLQFSSTSGKLECEYCESSFEVAQIEALYAEKERAAAAAQAQSEQEEAQQQAEAQDLPQEEGPPNTDWGQDAENMRAYNCPSCGAQLICDETTAATSCPYCGNPTIVPGQFSGTRKPDFVIPFRLDKEAAKKQLKKHYGRNPFLPKEFTDANHIEQIKGVYVPFWLFNTTATGEATYHASRSTVHTSGDYRITKTMHYNVFRSGGVQFFRVPADASSKMPDNYMDAVEPFDYSDLQPFSTAYLPGYLADRYDVAETDCSKRVRERCKNTLQELLRSDVLGYMEVTPVSGNAKVEQDSVQYVLLPVWVLNTRWKDNTYLFIMNGQTGKFVGELPSSKGKFWSLTAAFTAAATALIYLCGIGSWLAAWLFG